ncbi:hypothetical protein SDC9_96373 [bioreactor metagenome]|uniref:Uncharacterized protein n=1 Tax=bioreactor metagenome TaxID=1076179 RepID=A0A645AFP1_9ZZZZ
MTGLIYSHQGCAHHCRDDVDGFGYLTMIFLSHIGIHADVLYIAVVDAGSRIDIGEWQVSSCFGHIKHKVIIINSHLFPVSHEIGRRFVGHQVDSGDINLLGVDKKKTDIYEDCKKQFFHTIIIYFI